MRADISTVPLDPHKSAAGSIKPQRPNDYVVAPLLVNNLLSQCAAHFLAQFASNSPEHVRDVLKCGIHRPGGLVDEVGYWFGQCESDASDSECEAGYWSIEDNGPWVYENLAAVDVARTVSRHTKGWSFKDFAAYGYTIKDKAELDAAISSMK